jgi:hypothetical protein
LKVKILDKEDFLSWDNFVDSSPQGDVFCYSWWLDAITKSNFRLYAAFDNDEIVAGIPLAFDRHNKINEPPLTRTLGILFKPLNGISDHKITFIHRHWLNALLEHIPLNDFIQMCMHHNFTDWLPFKWKGLKQTTRYTYLLNYSDLSEEQLWRKLNRGKRSITKKAEKNGIRVSDTDDFDQMYHFVGLSFKRQGLKFRIPYKDLKNLDEALVERHKRIILKAFDNENRTHAMIYLAYNKKSAYYLLSGSDEKYRALGGHTLVLWGAVEFFSDKVGYFNFGGSDIKNIEEHIGCFGGTLTPYFHIYNEHLLYENDIRYNINKSLFHMCCAIKAIKAKLFMN